MTVKKLLVTYLTLTFSALFCYRAYKNFVDNFVGNTGKSSSDTNKHNLEIL